MALDDLVGGPRRASTVRAQNARGRVVRAPLNNDDDMRVVLANYSEAHDYEVPASQWVAAPDDAPQGGDVCLVQFDDNGDAWVTAWGRPSG